MAGRGRPSAYPHASGIDLDVDESLGAEHALEIGAQRLRLGERSLLEFLKLRHVGSLELRLFEGRGVCFGVGDTLADFREKVRTWDGWIVASLSRHDRLGLGFRTYGKDGIENGQRLTLRGRGCLSPRRGIDAAVMADLVKRECAAERFLPQ